jgi:hypothetical protein
VTAEFVIGAYHQLFQIEKSFRMAKSDLQARPLYHRTRDSIEAHLTMVFAALAVSRWIERQTGWSIRKFVKTARRYRTIQIQAGPHTITAADPLPDDLRQAIDNIHGRTMLIRAGPNAGPGIPRTAAADRKRRQDGLHFVTRRPHSGSVNKTRIGAGLFFLGAAICLGVIWPMWAAVLGANQNVPPAADGPAMAVISVFVISCFLVAGAGALVAVAIWRLRRK